MTTPPNLSAGPSPLSPKEALALELVAAQLTTKEIARELGVTPRAVEERLKSARDKLNAPDRRAAARIYMGMQDACGQTTSGPTTVDPAALRMASNLRDLPATSVFALEDSAVRNFTVDDDTPTFLEAFDVRFGKPGRVAAIVLLATTLGLLGAAAVSIAVTLGQIM